MPRTIPKVLSNAAGDVLETMFFTSPLGAAACVAGEDGPALGTHLRFEGNPSGSFALAVSEPAARTIAGNFLGADDEEALELDQVSEVLGELANMICGSALSRIEPDVAFEIRHPETIPAADAVGGAGAESCSLYLGNGTLTAVLRFDARECA